MKFTFRAFSAETWKDFESLMGEKGGCGGCWCMYWRTPRGGKMWEEAKGAPARSSMKRLCAAGKARGILAYADGKPAGWCTFGPRTDFPRLERVKAYAGQAAEGAWSVPCFYVAPAWRGKNLSFLLLGRALEEAGRLGALVVEGYPVTRTKSGAKLPSAFSWVGPEVIFQRHGFSEAARESAGRPLYRKQLRGR